MLFLKKHRDRILLRLLSPASCCFRTVQRQSQHADRGGSSQAGSLVPLQCLSAVPKFGNKQLRAACKEQGRMPMSLDIGLSFDSSLTSY